jgi:hypothetical protein
MFGRSMCPVGADNPVIGLLPGKRNITGDAFGFLYAMSKGCRFIYIGESSYVLTDISHWLGLRDPKSYERSWLPWQLSTILFAPSYRRRFLNYLLLNFGLFEDRGFSIDLSFDEGVRKVVEDSPFYIARKPWGFGRAPSISVVLRLNVSRGF